MADVRRVDLVEKAETVAAQVSVVSRPRAGLGTRDVREWNAAAQFDAGHLAAGVEREPGEVSEQVQRLLGRCRQLRHQRFLANDLDRLILSQQM
jgi:hypothetical protein